MNTLFPIHFGEKLSIRIAFAVIGFWGSIYLTIPHIAELADLLWAEDANIFINEVLDQGYHSITKTYAGYFHLYPRLWTLAVLPSGLKVAPLYMLAGWIVAAGFTSYLLVKSMQGFGVSYYAACMLALLVFLQPSTGEVYYTITNAQWFLGFALAISCLTLIHKYSLMVGGSLLVVMCLTGPFCVLMVPALAIKFWLAKDWQPRKPLVCVFALCAVIQLLALATSNRPSLDIDDRISEWIGAAYTFMSLGMTGLAKILSLVFWLIFFKLIYKNIRGRGLGSKESSAFALLAYGLTVYLAAIYASKHAPGVLSPVGGGSRYFWIPYATIFSATLLLCKTNLDKYLAFGILSLICVLGVNAPKVGRQYTDFHTNLALSGITNNDLRINPFWPVYPDAWKINGDRIPQVEISHISRVLAPDDIKVLTGTGLWDSSSLVIQDQDSDPSVTFNLPEGCESYAHFAIAADVERSSPTQAQVFWAEEANPNFSEIKSRKRFVGAGRTQLTLATRLTPKVKRIRFDPSSDSSVQRLRKVTVYCF
jgi:hypothetical protein